MFILLWLHHQYNDVQPCNFPVFIYYITHQDSQQRKLTFMMEGIQDRKCCIYKGRFTCPFFKFSTSKPQKIIVPGESWIIFHGEKRYLRFLRAKIFVSYTYWKMLSTQCFNVCSIVGYIELFWALVSQPRLKQALALHYVNLIVNVHTE